MPAIVDVSEFTMAGRVRFVTAFLEELYQVNRSPLTLVIDEADMFAPQRPGKDQLTMLGRMEQICRRGRVRGFRPWLITQRPASLHKSVLSQANTLIAMQLTAPQDRDALGDWIEGQADREQGKRSSRSCRS
jgi:DNA helicase HerA-like ATPase